MATSGATMNGDDVKSLSDAKILCVSLAGLSHSLLRSRLRLLRLLAVHAGSRLRIRRLRAVVAPRPVGELLRRRVGVDCGFVSNVASAGFSGRMIDPLHGLGRS